MTTLVTWSCTAGSVWSPGPGSGHTGQCQAQGPRSKQIVRREECQAQGPRSQLFMTKYEKTGSHDPKVDGEEEESQVYTLHDKKNPHDKKEQPVSHPEY